MVMAKLTRAPPCGWCTITLACGKQCLSPGLPAVNSSDPILHAWPIHQVEIGGWIYWNGIKKTYTYWLRSYNWHHIIDMDLIFEWNSLFHMYTLCSADMSYTTLSNYHKKWKFSVLFNLSIYCQTNLQWGKKYWDRKSISVYIGHLLPSLRNISNLPDQYWISYSINIELCISQMLNVGGRVQGYNHVSIKCQLSTRTTTTIVPHIRLQICKRDWSFSH